MEVEKRLAAIMTTQTTSDFLIRRINEWGLKRIYGYPGDGINGIMGALDRANGAVEYIQVRHEEMAAFMACAHAKFTGEVGICLATSGPGAIHLLNGLYDAKMDHASVVAIVGQQARAAIGCACITVFISMKHRENRTGIFRARTFWNPGATRAPSTGRSRSSSR